LKLRNFFEHLRVIIRHRHRVFVHCVKCGIPIRGLLHDLSKFTPEEFFESVKYYTGYRSPIGVCRRETGMSRAWLHHKGRNKHHIEYWYDQDCKIQPLMPYKYAVECFCDKLAATKIYKGREYNTSMPLEHWTRYGHTAPGNPRTMAFLEKLFLDLEAHGEKYVLNNRYMKATYQEICLSENSEKCN